MQGNSSSQTTPITRCTRSQAVLEWTTKEVVVLLSEIAAIDELWFKQVDSYQRWKMISNNCMASNVVRSSNQCKRKWEMLLDDYWKIVNWESQSMEDFYWVLPEEERKDYSLPVSFQREVFDAIEAIIEIQQQQQSDSSDSDVEHRVGTYEFQATDLKADSASTRVCERNKLIALSRSVAEQQATTSNYSKERPAAKEPGTASKRPEEKPEAKETIIFFDNSKLDYLTTFSDNSEERAALKELNIASAEKRGTKEIMISFGSSKFEDLITTSKPSEGMPALKGLNATWKDLEKRREEELITRLMNSEVEEEPISTSKRPKVEKKPEMLNFNSALTSLEKRPEEEELVAAASKVQELEELITASKSVEKACGIAAFKNVEPIANSKISEKTRAMAARLQWSAEHVHSILRGELRDGTSHCPSPTEYSLEPSIWETKFARRQADELIEALAKLTSTLDGLCEHIGMR